MCYDRAMSEIHKNLKYIREKLAISCQKAGRSEEEVQLMAVSKNHPWEAVREAYEAGQHLFGENRVQEALEKFQDRPDDLQVHMIGHLQSNKAAKIPGNFAMVQSVDKMKTARALNKKASQLDVVLPLLIEVNTSGEASKNGVESEDDLWRLVEGIQELDFLKIQGLMTLAPFIGEEKPIRKSFSLLHQYYQKGRDQSLPWDILSMGMSGDFHWAIEEGSTLVRVGTAIFGHRQYSP